MIELGKTQFLYVTKVMDFGVYLNDEIEKTKDSILLPKKYVPEGQGKIGDKIKVFVYKDSEDRWIATTKIPILEVGELAVCKVIEVGKIGAFVNIGLEKDILLPFKEQTRRVHTGKEYLVSLYVDKSERLCATMHIYKFLLENSPYKKNDKVTGIVYDIKPEFGVFVAIDNKYHGMILKREIHREIKIGEIVTARVLKVREDGKLDLSLNEKAYIQMDVDCKTVMDVIDSYDGVLPFNDKASPEIIERELNLSKNAFKRAVGRLLKSGKIKINDKTIRKL